MTDTNSPAQLDEVHETSYEIESMPDETTTTDKSYSQGQLVLRRFVRHRGAMISLSILVLILAAVFIPWMRLVYRGAGIKRTGLHLSGATPLDFLPETSGRVGTNNLFESPTAVIRGALVPKKTGKAEQH